MGRDVEVGLGFYATLKAIVETNFNSSLNSENTIGWRLMEYKYLAGLK